MCGLARAVKDFEVQINTIVTITWKALGIRAGSPSVRDGVTAGDWNLLQLQTVTGEGTVAGGKPGSGPGPGLGSGVGTGSGSGAGSGVGPGGLGSGLGSNPDTVSSQSGG